MAAIDGLTQNVSGLVSGAYGFLRMNAGGTFGHDLDNRLDAFQGLRAGQTLTERFAYTVTDAAGGMASATLAITIVGRNDRPLLVSDAAVATGGGGRVTGMLLANDSDPENDQLSVTSIRRGWDVFAPGDFIEIPINAVLAAGGTLGITGEITSASLTDPDSTPGKGTLNGEDDQSTAAITVTVPEPAVFIDQSFTAFEDHSSINSTSFQLKRTGDLLNATTVTWWLGAGITAPASSPADLVGGFRTGTATFAPGQDLVNGGFRLLDDPIPEPAEFVRLTLTGATDGRLDPTQGLGTATDLGIPDQDPITYRFEEWFGGFEGTTPGGPGMLTFRVTRDAAFQAATLTNAIEGTGLTTSAVTQDIVGGFGQRKVTFAEGELEKLIDIQTTADRFIEGNESVFVRLVPATEPGRSTRFGQNSGTLTVIDDDSIGTIEFDEDVPQLFPVFSDALAGLAGIERYGAIRVTGVVGNDQISGALGTIGVLGLGPRCSRTGTAPPRSR